MSRLALRIGASLVSISLLASGQSMSSTASDRCRSTTPPKGCPRVEIPPRPVHLVRPDYPLHGRKKKHGLVRLQATVTDSGELKDVRVPRGGREIARAALDAVRQWRYRPSEINGVPMQVQHEITVNFTEDDGVLLGADDLPANLPLEPSEDLYEMFRDGRLFVVGASVNPPKALYFPDPAYTEAARRTRYNGSCALSVVVGEDGTPRDIWVVRPLG